MVEFKEPVFSSKVAAKILNISPGRLRQLVCQGRIKPIRLSRELIIPESEIRKYQRERRKYRKRTN